MSDAAEAAARSLVNAGLWEAFIGCANDEARRQLLVQANHAHSWIRCTTLADQQPPLEVFDCGCGRRKFIQKGYGGQPDVELDYHPAVGSAENALRALSS